MTRRELFKLVQIHSALDDALGDSDLVNDMTDNELRDQEPVTWAAIELAKLIGRGPWGDYRRSKP